MNKVATKEEVLQSLSVQLRRPALEDKMFVKLLTLFAKLSGWFDDPKPPAPTETPVKTPSALDIVLEEERKRRAKG